MLAVYIRTNQNHDFADTSDGLRGGAAARGLSVGRSAWSACSSANRPPHGEAAGSSESEVGGHDPILLHADACNAARIAQREAHGSARVGFQSAPDRLRGAWHVVRPRGASFTTVFFWIGSRRVTETRNIDAARSLFVLGGGSACWSHEVCANNTGGRPAEESCGPPRDTVSHVWTRIHIPTTPLDPPLLSASLPLVPPAASCATMPADRACGSTERAAC